MGWIFPHGENLESPETANRRCHDAYLRWPTGGCCALPGIGYFSLSNQAGPSMGAAGSDSEFAGHGPAERRNCEIIDAAYPHPKTKTSLRAVAGSRRNQSN